MTSNFDLIVVGSGLCGLTIAITAARRGLATCCIGDGRPGASLANFGQLHSGAIYAPVLPDVARACWRHRDRWTDIASQARIGPPYGYGLFATQARADVYRQAWDELGIAVTETDPHGPELASAAPVPAAAFRLPDYSVDLVHLYRITLAMAADEGVVPVETAASLHRGDPDSSHIALDGAGATATTVVLATGQGTQSLLGDASIAHTLRNRRIPWGEVTGPRPSHLTYWLDDDLLAVSPTSEGARAGLPAPSQGYDTAEAEEQRLRTSLEHHGLATDAWTRFQLRWGSTCEPSAAGADPTSLVADLRNPPPGWDRIDNLLVALPGKWATAWHCADQAVDALT